MSTQSHNDKTARIPYEHWHKIKELAAAMDKSVRGLLAEAIDIIVAEYRRK